MENKTKKDIIGLTAIILSVMPLKNANAENSFFKDIKGISLECSISYPEYSEIKQANEEKNNQMRDYIPNWKNLPNPGALAMNGIVFRNKIPGIEKDKFFGKMNLDLIIGISGGQSKARYDEEYNGDYKNINSVETVSINELKIGVEKNDRINDKLSYSILLGFTSDEVDYTKSRTTTFSDSSSGKIETSTVGMRFGNFLEIAGKYKIHKKFYIGAGIGIKKNNVNTFGTEKFTDYADSSNNYSSYKEINIGLNRAEGKLYAVYEFEGK